MSGTEVAALSVPSHQKVAELKRALTSKVGVPPPYQQLSLDSSVLQDVHTLAESAVPDGARLELVLVTVPSTLPAELHDLVLPDDEVAAHARVLTQMPWHTAGPRAVADYLFENRVLLTSAQAARIFNALVGKVINKRDGLTTYNARAQLILALHSFVLDQMTVWEKNDGSDGCLWANMSSFLQNKGDDPCKFATVLTSPDKSFDQVVFLTAFSRDSWRNL